MRRRSHLLLAVVEGLDHGGVLLGHEAAPHLAGARHLRVVRLELLVEQQEARDLLVAAAAWR